MTVNIDIHLKKDDSFEASVIKDEEERDFIVLQKYNLTIYFEGEDYENYKNACHILDHMKNAIQEAWLEKGRMRGADHEKEKVQEG